MNFDEIVGQVGEFGLYQKRLYVLVCLPAIFTAMQTVETIFLLDIPKHRCAISDNDTYRIQDENHARLVNASIPYEADNGDMGLSSCLMFVNTNSSSNDTEKCHSWVYDTSVFPETVATKFNMVCDDLIIHSHANMAMFAGSLGGALIMGYLSDLIGRKITFFISVALLTISSIVTAFCPNVYVFIAVRLVNAFSATAAFITGFVIGLEMVGPSKRMIAGMGIEIFWCAGLFILSVVTYFIRHWQTMQLVISVPSVLLFSLWWLVPESPRWLMSRGRLPEVGAILKNAAKVNGAKLPSDIFQQLTHEEVQTGKMHQLFTSRTMRNRTFIIFFNWFVVNMIYYGLGLNVQNLSGDIFINFLISNVVETAAYVVCMLTLDRAGRKILHCGSMLLGGLACVAVLFPVIYKGPDWVTILLSMVGKLGASGAFAVIYVFAGELFPTVVRNSSLGLSSTCGKIGGMVSPYIADLGVLIGGDLKVALPQVVFGGFAVAAGSVSLFLPETLNRKLPETIEDAKTFGQSDSSSNYDLKEKENCDDIQLKTVRPSMEIDVKSVKLS